MTYVDSTLPCIVEGQHVPHDYEEEEEKEDLKDVDASGDDEEKEDLNNDDDYGEEEEDDRC